MKMNTAIINISDRAFSAVGFTVLWSQTTERVCAWVASGRIDANVHLVFILSASSRCRLDVLSVSECVLCVERSFSLPPSLSLSVDGKTVCLRLCVRISAHHVDTRQFHDIRISIWTNDSDCTSTKKCHAKIESMASGIHGKNGGTMVFRYIRFVRAELRYRFGCWI